MNKIIILILLVLGLSCFDLEQSRAEEVVLKEKQGTDVQLAKENEQLGLTAEVLNQLNDEELYKISDRILQDPTFKNLSEEAQLKRSITAYIEVIKGKKRARSYIGSLNDAEKQLVQRHPLQALVVWASKRIALTETIGWYGGKQEDHRGDNGDAFRHAFWNADMVNGFMHTFGFTLDSARHHAEVWTLAHEESFGPSEFMTNVGGAAQIDGKMERYMDIYNNRVGRSLISGRTDWPSLSKKVKQAADRGDLKVVVYKVDLGGYRYLYTTNSVEAFRAYGGNRWSENYKGIAFFAGSGGNGRPIYRLYNRSSRRYLWTRNVNEYIYLRANGWNGDGQAFNESPSGNAVYRLYHPGVDRHYWTVNPADRDYKLKRGWRNEGIAFKG